MPDLLEQILQQKEQMVADACSELGSLNCWSSQEEIFGAFASASAFLDSSSQCAPDSQNLIQPAFIKSYMAEFTAFLTHVIHTQTAIVSSANQATRDGVSSSRFGGALSAFSVAALDIYAKIEQHPAFPYMTSDLKDTLYRGMQSAKKVGETGRNISQSSSSGGCYVATCVYGSYDCPEVWTLRRFRDCILAQSAPGRAFIRAYYATSPFLVKRFGNRTWFRNAVKPALDHLVARCRRKGVSDTPYDDRS